MGSDPCPPRHRLSLPLQEEAEDLIDDRDVDLPDAVGPSQANYRLLGRDRDLLEEKTEEELARSIEDRYRQYDTGRGDGLDEDAEAGEVGQQGLLPTLNDPKLWIVTCRPGRAREACAQLLQKYYTMHATATPLRIKSAFALDHLKVSCTPCGGGGETHDAMLGTPCTPMYSHAPPCKPVPPHMQVSMHHASPCSLMRGVN